MSFGAKMREARKQLGASQAELASKVGVFAHQISDWECDRVVPGFEMAIAVADALGVSLDWLAERKEGDPQILKDRSVVRCLEVIRNEILQHQKG